MVKASNNLYRRLQICKESVNNLKRDIANGVRVSKEDYYNCQQQLYHTRKVLYAEIYNNYIKKNTQL